LFPCYLFVRLGEFRWSVVETTRSAGVRLLKSGERPAQLKGRDRRLDQTPRADATAIKLKPRDATT
jgi:hypothetical protein